MQTKGKEANPMWSLDINSTDSVQICKPTQQEEVKASQSILMIETEQKQLSIQKRPAKLMLKSTINQQSLPHIS